MNALQEIARFKTVQEFAGMCLLFAQMTGPGIPFTASNFGNPGWVFTIVAYLLFCFISGFSMLFLIQAIQSIPGNSHFQGNVEYSTLIHFYFGPSAHVLGQFILYGALQSNAMQGMALIAQAVDSLLIEAFGGTCGVSFGMQWICVTESWQQTSSPFGNVFMLFTLGYLITLACTVSLGLMKLESNIVVIVFTCVLSVLMSTQWVSAAIINGLDLGRVPSVTPISADYGQVMGTVMLNLACSIIVPSWINVKAMQVEAQRVIWKSIFFTSAYYILMGLFLALGFDIDDSSNVFSSILQQGYPAILSKITIGLFAFVALLPCIFHN